MSTTQRIVDVIPLIPPAGALTGWAAAFVYGVDTLDGLRSDLSRRPIAICCGADLGRRNTSRITYTRDRLEAQEVHVIEGIRVVEPLRAAFDGARLAGTLEDAVVFVDACAHAGVIRLSDLSTYVEGHRGWRGVRQAVRAVGLADPATRSPGESRLRLFYTIEAGLPHPQVNLPIFNLREGLIGIGDLFDETAALVTEYDGSLHRERVRHRCDNVREEAFESAGLVVVRVDALDLRSHRAELVDRLRDGHRRGMRRDRRHDRWTTVEPAWWTEQQDPEQFLTPDERAALYRF